MADTTEDADEAVLDPEEVEQDNLHTCLRVCRTGDKSETFARRSRDDLFH
jgi:hypothetical protein